MHTILGVLSLKIGNNVFCSYVCNDIVAQTGFFSPH